MKMLIADIHRNGERSSEPLAPASAELTPVRSRAAAQAIR
jgi:hypothetical protein